MKQVDINDIDKLPGIRIAANDVFCFRCYPGIACFNKCCCNLNLFLYPYDVLRLKNCLGITSDAFIDRYVDIVLSSNNFFPEVLLRMADNPAKTCPFSTDSGCSVYADRPDTCRMFPIEQGIFFDAATQNNTLLSLFRPPDFCLGQHDQKQWTIQTWTQAQDARRYHQMTTEWAEIKRLFQTDPWGSQGSQGPKAKMAFMATYNLDRFRDFVFNSSFLKRYKVKSVLQKKIKTDDTRLLEFGFEWLKLFVWGIKSKIIRPK